jgi:transposase
VILNLPPTVRVFVATAPVDLRKSFDGLSAAVAYVLERDPLCGHLFVFLNRRADRTKVLWYDGNGFALFYKRLERGRFRWLGEGDLARACIEISAVDLALILQGIDLRGARRRRGWSPKRGVPKGNTPPARSHSLS